MTAHLEPLFQRSSVLRRGRYDRLMPASPAVDRELTALVKRFAEDAEARPQAPNLSPDPMIDMLVRPHPAPPPTSEDRRVGKGVVRTCTYWWSPFLLKQQKQLYY